MKQMSPEIDARNFRELLKRLRSMAPFYTPEWHAREEKEPGNALTNIYIYLYELIIDRLNQVPHKNFAAFLEMMGIDLQPAQSATMPVTFTLVDGAVENVIAPPGAQLIATAADAAGQSQEVVFETEKSLSITPAKLLHVFSIDAAQDQIFDHSQAAAALTPFTLFEGKNSQEHSLYIGHKDLLNQKKPAVITVDFTVAAGADGSDALKFTWEYWNGSHWVNLLEFKERSEDFNEAKVDSTNRFQTNGSFTLEKNHTAEIAEKEFDLIENGVMKKIKSRWIRCRLTSPATEAVSLKLPVLNTVRLGVQPKNPFAPDLAFNNDFPLDVGEIEVKMQAKDITLQNFFELSEPLPIQFYIEASAELKAGDFLVFDNLLDPKEVRQIVAIEERGSTFNPPNISYFITLDQPLAFNYQSYNPPTILTALRQLSEDVQLDLDSIEGFEVELGSAVNLIRGSTREQAVIKDIVNISEEKTRLTLIRSGEISYFLNGNTATIIPTIKPFGEMPRLFDTFYIASDEAFSKKGAEVTLHIVAEWKDCDELMCSPPGEEPQPVLSWEYWNGVSWRGLRVKDKTGQFRHKGTIEFVCPDSITMVEVNGEKKFWIRARLIDGDYGREIVLVESGSQTTVKEGHIYFPIIKELKIAYEDIEREPEFCLASNNLALVDHTGDSIDIDKNFTPFKILPEQYPGVFLAFDKRLTGGPLRVLFSVQEQAVADDSRLKMQWSLWTGAKWLPVNVEDETENLMKIGLLTFSGSREAQKARMFGSQAELYWLKGSVIEDAYPQNPRVKGIFPNTVSAFQASAVEDETLGSSDGTANQEFSLIKFPIISQQVWVNEGEEPNEEDREAVIAEEGEDAIIIEKDEKEDVTAVWIRWHTVENFDESTDHSRHYTVDRRLGKIRFGNGSEGLVPPPGANNITIDYKFGGGKIGNSAVITGLKNAIPFVKAVANHLTAAGGSETETLEEAMARGPQKLKHRERAITPEDFEALAKDAARIVARARCLPGVDEEGNFTPGWVTVVIIPQSEERAPKPSHQLLKVVKEKLATQCANTVSAPDHIHVRQPDYIEITVETVVTPISLDVASQVEEQIRRELERFIHPLTGGAARGGWEFSRPVCRSEIFGLLEGVEDVQFVANLKLFANGVEQPGDVAFDPFTLPISGEHRIQVLLPVQQDLLQKGELTSNCVVETGRNNGTK